MGGPENGNFPLLYVMKMSLRRGWVVLKSLKIPLRNIKMVLKLDSFMTYLLTYLHKYFSWNKKIKTESLCMNECYT